MRIILLGLLCITLMAVTAWWASSDEPSSPALSFQDEQGSGLDYYLRDVKTTSLGPDGQPIRILQAAEIRHLQADGGSQLQQPSLLMYPDTGPPWRIEAASGRLSASGDMLMLDGAVQITRAQSPTTAPVQLDTQHVRIQTRQHYFETDEPVQIVSAAHRLQATGLQAWLQTPVKLHFLHAVRGRYVPNE